MNDGLRRFNGISRKKSLTNALLATIVGIAVLDSVNPTATAIHLYLLSTVKPIPRALAFVLGVFGANYLGGFIAVLGLAALWRELTADWSGLIGASARWLLGLTLILAGYHLYRRRKPQSRVKKPRSLRPVHAFILGIAVTSAELPTALPYLAAIAALAQASLRPAETAGALLVYNIVFVLPLLVLTALYLILSRKRAVWLEKLERAVSLWFPRLLPIFLMLLGVALIASTLADRFGCPFLCW
jgi:cytochrome c biogenesis protein CcdA